MPKTRVYELAKTLGIDSKELIEKLKGLGVEVKTHMSAIDDKIVKTVSEGYSKKENSSDNKQDNKSIKNKRDNKSQYKKDEKRDFKQTEKNKDRPSEKRDFKQTEKNKDKFTDKRNDKQSDKFKGKFIDKKNDRQSDKFKDKPFDKRNDRQSDKSKDKPFDKRNDKQSDKFKDKFNNKRNDNQNDKYKDKFADKRNDNQNDKYKDKFADKRNSNQNDRYKDKFADKRNDRQTDKYKDRFTDKRNDKQSDKYKDKSSDKRSDRQSDKYKDKREFKRSEKEERKEKPSEKITPFPFEEIGKNVQKKKNKKNKKNKSKLENLEKEVADINNLELENDIKTIQLGKTVTVKELAEKLEKNYSDVVMRLMKIGIMASINQEIEYPIAAAICEEFDVIAEEKEEIDLLEEAFREEDDREEDMVERPPIVVVMGHVDHGKTSLLDAIRHSRITAKEAGGITQHIGAYTVSVDKKTITFLDTPGHEAFTAMRMRGAQVTDVAILVVAADDGVMPQTIEAINHAKAAGVEIIVAINKIDKESASPDRVKQELTEYGLLAEDWGGDTICVPVSAATKQGIDQLLEMIILVSEMKELKANPDKRARGTIIEAQLDKGRGPVATVLVQNGTLKVGDPIVAGCAYGRIRAMMNDKGQKVKKATPSMPVEVLGLSEVPTSGDMFYVASNEKQARQAAESVVAKGRVDMIKDTPQKVSLDDLFSQIQSGNVKELNIVIKADVHGSVEAVKASLEKLSNEEVRIRTIHGGVGAITESDVMLASASNAIIIGFNVRPEASAKSVAEDQKVDIRLYRVIYNAIEDITAAMKGMLDPVYEEKIVGHAEIRRVIKISSVGSVGGSYVTDGKIIRNAQVRIVRDGKVVYEGELATLRRFKDDVKEVNSGYECGISFNRFNDIKEKDVVEAFVMEEIKQ